MKANELMIGDWVQGFLPDTNSKVVGILNDVQIAIIGGGAYMELDVDDLQPILLTPEILEKNGFENDFYENESVADYVKVRLEGYSLKCKANGWDNALVTWCNGHLEVVTDFNGEVRTDIDYIHQLQHALRLCGIDKEITV